MEDSASTIATIRKLKTTQSNKNSERGITWPTGSLIKSKRREYINNILLKKLTRKFFRGN